MKLISWNVNGIRSILGKGLMDYLEREKPDVLCLQEIKARPEQVPQRFDGYEVYWNSAVRPGYSGTANWAHVAAVKQAVKMPVIGNGDVQSWADARRLQAEGRTVRLLEARPRVGGRMHSTTPIPVRIPTISDAMTTETTLRGRKNDPTDTG